MMKIWFFALFIFFYPLTVAAAQDAGYTVSGEVCYNGGGKVYILLTDEKSSKIPFEGIRKTIIETTENSGAGYSRAYYSFSGIPEGYYGIRCFQDVNENGRLDKGLFGPSEPWGMSWSKKKAMPPDFSDYSFYLNQNLVIDDIILGQ